MFFNSSKHKTFDHQVNDQQEEKNILIVCGMAIFERFTKISSRQPASVEVGRRPLSCCLVMQVPQCLWHISLLICPPIGPDPKPMTLPFTVPSDIHTV